jgi:hypothetical protein
MVCIHDVNIQDVVRIPYVADDADEMRDLSSRGIMECDGIANHVEVPPDGIARYT